MQHIVYWVQHIGLSACPSFSVCPETFGVFSLGFGFLILSYVIWTKKKKSLHKLIIWASSVQKPQKSHKLVASLKEQLSTFRGKKKLANVMCGEKFSSARLIWY